MRHYQREQRRPPITRQLRPIGEDHEKYTFCLLQDLYSRLEGAFCSSVGSFGRLLVGTPPRLVRPVPLDGRLQTGAEIPVDRLPTEFGLQTGRVDRVAQVVSRPIGHEIEIRFVPIAQLENGLDDRAIVRFTIGPMR